MVAQVEDGMIQLLHKVHPPVEVDFCYGIIQVLYGQLIFSQAKMVEEEEQQ